MWIYIFVSVYFLSAWWHVRMCASLSLEIFSTAWRPEHDIWTSICLIPAGMNENLVFFSVKLAKNKYTVNLGCGFCDWKFSLSVHTATFCVRLLRWMIDTDLQTGYVSFVLTLDVLVSSLAVSVIRLLMVPWLLERWQLQIFMRNIFWQDKRSSDAHIIML